VENPLEILVAWNLKRQLRKHGYEEHYINAVLRYYGVNRDA